MRTSDEEALLSHHPDAGKAKQARRRLLPSTGTAMLARMAALTTDLIGRASAPLTLDVEKGHIRRFAEAIGDENPIYRDDAAARSAGHPAIPAPPTFAAALRPNDVRAGLDIDWTRLLHGEQAFEYRRPLYAGDRITLVQRIADVYEKTGKAGTMDFLVLESEGRDASDQLVFTAQSTLVIRR